MSWKCSRFHNPRVVSPISIMLEIDFVEPIIDVTAK